MEEVKCIVCGNDNLLRLKDLSRSAAPAQTGKLPPLWAAPHRDPTLNLDTLKGSGLELSAAQIHDLQQLSPPPRPVLPHYQWIQSWGAIALSVVLLLVFGAVLWATLTFTPVTLFNCMLIAAGFLCLVPPTIALWRTLRQQLVHLARHKMHHDYNRWARAMRHWNTLHYCPVCDHIINPTTNQAVAPTDLHHLLT